MFRSLTFTGKPREKFMSTLTKAGFNTIFKTNNGIGRYIKNKLSDINEQYKSGVFKLRCGTYKKFYVGKTFKHFFLAALNSFLNKIQIRYANNFD